MVKVGDSIPDLDFHEGSPGDKVNLAKELASGKGVIIGVPAASSPDDRDTQVPSYVASGKLQSAGKVFVVSPNEKAWGRMFEGEVQSGIRFIADPEDQFTRALDLEIDSNRRSKRYALMTEDGKITKVSVEPDNTGISFTSAE